MIDLRINRPGEHDGLIYIYCILNAQPELEGLPLNSGLKFLPVQEYYVAMKIVSPDEFSEENLKKNFADLPWIEANAREHIEVINAIMKNHTVIPFKFGTIFNSEENIEKFIRDYAGSLSENFEAVQGKEEWAVKIYCEKKTLNNQVPDLSENIRTLEEQILKSSPGKAFLLKRKKMELVEQETARLMKINGQRCFDEYKNISQTVHINNLLPRELTERDDDMILNATFLIEKQRVADFIHVANLQQEKYQFIGFSFDVTGPWPPFSFVAVKEHR